MSSPKSPATATSSPALRESTRNSQADGVTPSSSWSTTSSTSPLRISKHESPLTSDAIPNPHYHRLPTQLARRQSSSFNHVRNNALVRCTVKPSRIPTPARASAKEDENKPELGFKRRQSRGLQGLFKEQVVTKSPFLGDKHSSTPAEVSLPLPPKPLPSPMSAKEPTQTRASTPPMPATPRNPRIADLSGRSPSPSPKSSLVSPKRLHGPRSLSASPASEPGRRQRRKTVTFDERCDVLEFDQDEVSEEVIDTEDDGEDEYGLPEPPSPAISASTDGSFASYNSDQVLHSPHAEPRADISRAESDTVSEGDQPIRTPRISRGEIRRRLLEQRTESFEEIPDVASLQATPETSFDVSSQGLQLPPTPEVLAAEPSHPRPQHVVSDQIDLGMTAPFDLSDPGIDLGEMHSALDRLMLGVESGFGIEPTEGGSMDTETATEGDMSANVNTSVVDVSADVEAKSISEDMGVREQLKEKPVHVNMPQMSEVGGIDEETHGPITPPMDNDYCRQPSIPNNYDSAVPLKPVTDLSDTPVSVDSDGSLLLAKSVDRSDTSVLDNPELDLSISDLEHGNLHMQTSTPPRVARKDPQLAAEDSHPPQHAPSQLPQSVRDDTFLVRSSSTASTTTNNSIPPPVPPKDDSAIQQRDEFVKARRREMRSEYERPATYHEGRPSRRRSLSTGDAEDLGSSRPASQRRAGRLRDDHNTHLLDMPLEQEDEVQALGDLIDRELKIRKKPTVKDKTWRMYKLRERENTIYASSDDKVSHMSQAGDIDNGKAWRTVRRPSDMNEYSRQIKEYRAQHKPGKAHGKVFVKVLGIRGVNVPLPNQPTFFTCTLNNGIHYVTTPECRLARDARIEQEFELIEHSKLEFTLTLTVRRDSHITAQAKSNTPAQATVAVAPAPPTPSSRGGVRGFFGVGSSPKKTHKVAVAAAVRATPEPVEDNIARYLKPDGTLARAFVSFKEIAKRCDTRLFESSFPLIGQRTGNSSSSSVANPWTMGEIVLQIFRLPPLPGIEPDKLPQSLEECHRGLRHINWHKVTYHEGILTQNGGDCRTWRRRLLRVIGSNLVAFNDVTKKATATIDLKKAIAVEDDDPMFPALTSLSLAAAARSRNEFDEVYRVERSFRLIFPNHEEISFFADNDEAKARWLEVFRALVGHIPPNPLWAELIWQRQDEMAKGSSSTSPPNASPLPREATAASR
ncbi:hypothetical protein JB92DRAFT_2903861 [Gautieria morchelliformis]|nr:hypothetical protein JB92DRAFT_2903861 [Gautieria morchelliformis]